MPIDLVLPLYLSNSEDLAYRKPRKPKPCISLSFAPSKGSFALSDADDVTAAHQQDKNHRKVKKKVSFADHRGQSLTRVKTFSQSKDPIEVPLSIQMLVDAVPSTATSDGDDKLVLDFEQPSADYLLFRQRLERGHVCLEHCVLRERTLAGTVRVKNLSFEKRVSVRITFDAWRSHEDVACAYILSTYPDSEHDTFSFEMILPGARPGEHHIEFAVCYEVPGGAAIVHWDSNQGKNYKVVWSSSRRQHGHHGDYNNHHHQGRRHSADLGIHFDRYGSPTCSHGLFPDWPSYALHRES
ncbi:hypothetical protein CRUP_006774 [Coryphaenoides rupestris]|nr:hypothetical protein CRUP_006774 [Coryphaenoides rupestris]